MVDPRLNILWALRRLVWRPMTKQYRPPSFDGSLFGLRDHNLKNVSNRSAMGRRLDIRVHLQP
jgi:hypothetical protein